MPEADPGATTLAVWEGPAPANDAEALTTFRQLLERWQDEGVVEAILAKMRGERTAYDPTPAIAAYVADLLRRWPDITDESEESPWFDAPLIVHATGPLFYFAMAPGHSKAQEAVTFAAGVAAQHGLNCFDPQSEHLLTSAIPTRDAPRRRWRRKG